jgi:hypothetical protein
MREGFALQQHRINGKISLGNASNLLAIAFAVAVQGEDQRM